MDIWLSHILTLEGLEVFPKFVKSLRTPLASTCDRSSQRFISYLTCSLGEWRGKWSSSLVDFSNCPSIPIFVLTPSTQGANSPLGIGRATAHQFAQNGAQAIYICDLRDDYLNTHQRELDSLYPDTDVHCRQYDVADEAAVRETVNEALERYGRLDIMLANAGVVGSNRTFSEIDGDEFMKTMRTNVLRWNPFERTIGLRAIIANQVIENSPVSS